ncbi:MAG: 6-phosphofructokinase [Gammaproteobacteria bacterium]|nr:6-phosphofructokinase [Gammaproteobacteria bacterium]
MPTRKKNAFYAQSGGVTAVINASACGVIETARKHGIKVYAGRNGIIGALTEDLIDTSKESAKNIASLRHTPGGAFGSCRYKLKSLELHKAEYERLIEVFKAHNIGYFFYNGGGDSQDTIHKVSQMSKIMNYPLICIGVPKTIDNDLPFTDACPGFGSVAKYIATSIREVGYDLLSMSVSSTKIFVMEVMGRNAGWIAAASGLASEKEDESPHIILLPEIAFNEEKFLLKVEKCVKKHGHCSIVVSEGLQSKEGLFLSDVGCVDAFGHVQLGGVAPMIAKLIKHNLGHKYHWAVADYMQRSARHMASKTDVTQAYDLGKAAVLYALKGKNNIMTTIVRKSDKPYRWTISYVDLEKVANVESKMPRNFITPDGFHITEACRRYLSPLIHGEDVPPFKNGLPQFVKLKNLPVKKKLKEKFKLKK